VHTEIAPTLADPPIPVLVELGFSVSVNPEKRLMSRTSATRELDLLMNIHQWTHEVSNL
jgi:adenosine deaminase